VHAQAPAAGSLEAPAEWAVVRGAGRRLDVPLTEAGKYRVEAWLKVAEEEMIWILSNPLYVQARK